MKLYFSGIGGSGMSALAVFASDRGHDVAGSDRLFDRNPHHPMKRILENRGIRIVPQDGGGPDETTDIFIYSTAVEEDHPEMVRARRMPLAAMSRPEFLAHTANSFQTVAVAGTSGKSTVAGLLAFLMDRLGMEPNFIGGGRVIQFRSSLNPGNTKTGSSDILVFEACESDGSIVHYRPVHTVITSLALDHHPVEETAVLFRTIAANTGKRVYINTDDTRLMDMAREETVTFSVNTPSKYRAEDTRPDHRGTSFRVAGQPFRINLPGLHNVYNALACISVLSEMGVPLPETALHMPAFAGIERRFEVHLSDGELLVVDDYAHNPHKIAAFMEAVQKMTDAICFVFQPHGYGPTRLMKDAYIETFSARLRPSDHLVILPIYYAGGSVERDISSSVIAEGIRRHGASAEAVEDRKTVLGMADRWKAFAIMGARDDSLATLASEVARLIARRQEKAPR